MRRKTDMRLYLIADVNSIGERDPLEVIVPAIEGGVTAVQLRAKNLNRSQFSSLAARILTVLRPKEVPLIINDDVQVAFEVRADGVHVGKDDCSSTEAREILGPKAIIGYSIENDDPWKSALSYPVDYLGLSPTFPTQTKSGFRSYWGLEGLRFVRGQTSLPLIAIGGISMDNVKSTLDAGADGVAVASAICMAVDVEKTTRSLRSAIEQAPVVRGIS